MKAPDGPLAKDGGSDSRGEAGRAETLVRSESKYSEGTILRLSSQNVRHVNEARAMETCFDFTASGRLSDYISIY